jgi:hypothetical protein
MLKFVMGMSVGIVLLALIFSEPDDYQARIYCDMRQIHKDTNGEFGWPDYRSDIECSK